jgi:hypothetical protein
MILLIYVTTKDIIHRSITTSPRFSTLQSITSILSRFKGLLSNTYHVHHIIKEKGNLP